MKYRLILNAFIVTVLLAFPVQKAFSVEQISAEKFARNDGYLHEYEAALYLFFKNDPNLGQVIDPKTTVFFEKKLILIMGDQLVDLKQLTGHDSPWTWQEIDKCGPKSAVSSAKTDQKNSASKDDGIYLRDNVSNLNLLDPNPKIAKGATFSFSQNRLKNNGNTWNSAGALGYRMTVLSSPSLGGGKSYWMWMTPAVSWNVSTTAGSSNNVEELEYNLPATFVISPGSTKSALWYLTARPFYLTDFSFADEIYGAEASAEFTGYVLGSSLYLGSFMDIPNTGLQYQLRIVPKFDYSVTKKGGIHTTREPGDDWFRAGGLTSLDISFSKDLPFVLGVSYEYKGVISGNGSNVHLFTTSGTWWLENNKNLALKFNYSKGQSIETAQKVDLITLGLELKN